MSVHAEIKAQRFLEWINTTKPMPIELGNELLKLLVAVEREAQETLRDEFAKAALVGLTPVSGEPYDPKYLAQESYVIADAMLAEREKKTEHLLNE